MATTQQTVFQARQAVEALRNGVPNRAAVRELGCNQPVAERQFVDMLDRVGAGPGSFNQSQGMLVSGDFGSGKSHLLAHLEQLALSRNFVCSRVAISKETPLYDLGKVFTSAMENGRLPNRGGRFIEELALAMKPESDSFRAFSEWADSAVSCGVLSPIFTATLCIYMNAPEQELKGDIESFWAGDRIRIAMVREGLRLIDRARNFRFRAPRVADLQLQRLPFAVELIKGVGFRGWVILLDEIELIGSYSILQRGRSYAEVARWMGRVQEASIPGLIVVGAVTGDFASAIISPYEGSKKDGDSVPPRLEHSARYADLAPHAEEGMRLLEEDCATLAPPTDEDVRATIEVLRSLYRRAYGWEAPPQQASASEAEFQARMRHKVRAAINEWDLKRLGLTDEAETEFVSVDPIYSEDTDLERAASDDPE